MRIQLLLTACIKPNSTDALAIRAAFTRKGQYLEAIQWYLDNTNFGITFCENSGTAISLSELDMRGHDEARLEILTYTSQPTIPERGKGYKEMEIIEYAFQHSAYLSKADIIIKGTGRLKLLNIDSVVKFLDNKHLEHFICSWMSIKKQHSDSRFFFCSPDYLKYFITFKEKISLHKNFEDNLALSIAERDKTRYKYIYPNVWYNISGIGGGFGSIYNITSCQYRKFNLKNLVYRLVFCLGYWPTKVDIY